jgi:hypothetical protein
MRTVDRGSYIEYHPETFKDAALLTILYPHSMPCDYICVSKPLEGATK